MKVTKTIKLLNSTDLEIIAKYAKSENITVNEVLRGAISNYAEQLQRQEAAKQLHADIDDLIVANNNVVKAMNYNTIVIGEALKIFLSKLKTAVNDSDLELEDLENHLKDMVTKKEGIVE